MERNLFFRSKLIRLVKQLGNGDYCFRDVKFPRRLGTARDVDDGVQAKKALTSVMSRNKLGAVMEERIEMSRM